MPPRLTACETCHAPISNFPIEATRNYGRTYQSLIEIDGHVYCSECAASLSRDLTERPETTSPSA